jgi:glycolate oxidase
MPEVSSLKSQLVEIVGAKYVTDELCDRLVYAKDYSIEGLASDYTPDMVVKPRSTDEIVRIVKLANDADTPIYTWGAGTSMSGNPLAVEHGIVLDMKRMNRILDIDTANLSISVEAGVTMDEAYHAARKAGVFFTHHPESSLSSTIGGALSCMGISIYGAKYGYAFDQVLGLEVVLGTGEVITIGGEAYLSIASHNLMNLFLGAEGTLGIITRAILKVYPLPATRRHVSIGFQDVQHAMAACKRIHSAGCWPETVYGFDRRSLIQYMERESTPIPDDVHFAFLFGYSGDPDIVETGLDVIIRCSSEHGGQQLPKALTEMWWESVNITRETFDKSNFALSHTEYEPDLIDACVPLSKFQEFTEYYEKLKVEFGWDDRNFGTFIVAAPRGPIPFAIYFSVPIDTRLEDEVGKWFEFKKKMYQKSIEIGGGLSEVNGMGLRSGPWAKEYLGNAWRLLKGIKDVVDPNDILNRNNRGFDQ